MTRSLGLKSWALNPTAVTSLAALVPRIGDAGFYEDAKGLYNTVDWVDGYRVFLDDYFMGVRRGHRSVVDAAWSGFGSGQPCCSVLCGLVYEENSLGVCVCLGCMCPSPVLYGPFHSASSSPEQKPRLASRLVFNAVSKS